MSDGVPIKTGGCTASASASGEGVIVAPADSDGACIANDIEIVAGVAVASVGGPVTSMKSLMVSARQRDSFVGESSEYMAQPNVVLSAAWCVVCTWLPTSMPSS